MRDVCTQAGDSLGFVTSGLPTCPKKKKKFPFPTLPSESEPKSCSFGSLSCFNLVELSLLVVSKSLEIVFKNPFVVKDLPSPEGELCRLARFNLKYFPVRRYQNEGKQTLSGLFSFVLFFF